MVRIVVQAQGPGVMLDQIVVGCRAHLPHAHDQIVGLSQQRRRVVRVADILFQEAYRCAAFGPKAMLVVEPLERGAPAVRHIPQTGFRIAGTAGALEQVGIRLEMPASTADLLRRPEVNAERLAQVSRVLDGMSADDRRIAVESILYQENGGVWTPCAQYAEKFR